MCLRITLQVEFSISFFRSRCEQIPDLIVFISITLAPAQQIHSTLYSILGRNLPLESNDSICSERSAVFRFNEATTMLNQCFQGDFAFRSILNSQEASP